MASLPTQFVVRLAILFGVALIAPGFHLRSLSVLSAAVGAVTAADAAWSRARLDLPRLNEWDETVAYLSIAWLAFRLF